MEKLKVGVSGINAVDNPGPGVGVAKSLKEWNRDISIVGLAYDAMEPGVYMKWLIEKSFLMPYPSQGADAFIDLLIRRLSRYFCQNLISGDTSPGPCSENTWR